MKRLYLAAALAITMMSCTGGDKSASEGGQSPEKDNNEKKEITLNDGKWRLDYYASDSSVAVMDSLQKYYLVFYADGTFGMQTDCNSLGGVFIVNGDSLSFENIGATQMMCPDVEVENAIKKLLPMIDTYAIRSNGILQLRSDARTMAQFSHIDD